jgi:hypothetical protein
VQKVQQVKKDLKYKEQLEKVMLDHLKAMGYPKSLLNEQIMEELPQLWNKLQESGLLKEGMTYEGFYEEAHTAYQMSQFQNFFDALRGKYKR